MTKRVPALLAASMLLAVAANAAGADLTLCRDTRTKLDAGGDVSDKELSAARQACQRAVQVPQDAEVKPKLDAAAVTVEDEAAKRHLH
jgi:hypothetical protein